MIRGLLPVELVNPGGSVSDSFVSFHILPDLFSSAMEGNSATSWTLAGNPIPFIFQQYNKRSSLIHGDESSRIMYVCGTVAAGISAMKFLFQTDNQPRFFISTMHPEEMIRDNITITYTYVSDP